MNRSLAGAAALLVVVLGAVPARGQAPLVVGSVRDQHGDAVIGATVVGQSSRGPAMSTATDAAGTFALHGGGIVSVQIVCRYCRTAIVPVNGEAPIVAIVQRYDALAVDSPSQWDLANLPYAHVESAIALRPFTLLSQLSAPYPGSVLSDRGLSPSGSLVVDNGAPNYDIVAGESPYAFIPAHYEQNLVFHDASNAFAYGDQAAGGVVDLAPFASGVSAEAATVGSEVITLAQAGSDSAAAAFGSITNSEESRQRGDVFASWPLAAEQSVTVAAGSEQGRDYESPQSAFAGSFSFADARFSVPRSLNLVLSATVDRGNYFWTAGEYPISTAWSDSNFSAGVHSSGPVRGFADVAVRSSTGFDDLQALPYGLPRIAATLTQTRVDAGLAASAKDYDVTAGVGAFWFGYSGGTLGVSRPARSALAIPSLDARLFPNGKWSLDLQSSGSFTLPTFMEQYLVPGPMPVQLERNALEAVALTYTDDARIRLSLEGASQDVAGLSTGKISSAGISAVWQIAPALALRAWAMHVTDTVPIYGGAIPFGGAVTESALWATYDKTGAVRADVIYRRDLLDDLPFYHVDGAISGPITGRLRWYAGAEDRLHRTFLDVGLRFNAR